MNEIKGETPDYKIGRSIGLKLTDVQRAGQEIEKLKERIDLLESGWQKCPVCDGNGKRFVYNPESEDCFKNCQSCSGHGIISTVTGKPPSDE